jgi:glycosyltransferase involved in cell wall biosynthesis
MKILWVKCDFLHPTTRGGQIRTLEIVKRLHARHEVHYLAYEASDNPEGLKRAPEYCTRAYPVRLDVPQRRSLAFVVQLAENLFSSMPLSLSRYHSAAMRKQIAAVLRESQFDSVVCDFLSPAPNFDHLENCVLFQHNVETMIWRRHAENAADPLRKLYFKVQADRMFRWERRMCREAAEVIAVSPQDAALMRDMFGVTRVTAIPTGVDIDFFRRPLEVQPKADLVFLGSMDWLPNIDGIEYFVREILPLIRKRMPACRLAVVGRTPSASIRALAERDSGIQVTGTVPDVRPWLWGSKVSIVPLRIGGGTRLKIYESMAAGTPTVSTSIGAEGLDVSHPANIRLADTPAAFAEQCVSLLENAQERERLAAEALGLVTAHFSWDVVTAEFERLLLAARSSALAPQPSIR